MADYGNSTDLGYLLTPLTSDVSSNLKSYALEVSTTWVNSKLPAPITGTVPDLVEKAATYYAYVFLLKNLYDTTGEESPMMDWYEKQANDLLGSYVEANATEESTMHPYSGTLTPTNVFTQRVKRTVEDDTDYDNVDDVEWPSEG
jgi:hypothetical protein